MVNKKYLLIAGMCTVIAAQSVQAQVESTTTGRDMTYRGASYDVLDSTYVPKGRRDQHRDFLEYRYDYPAKPRSMWEIGLGAGLYNVSGDVNTLMLWQKGGYGFHAHVRKAFGYVFSLRAQYNYGIAKGLGWQPSENYLKNPAWSSNYQAIPDPHNPSAPVSGPIEQIFHNYRMEAHQLNLDAVINLNNILFHKARNVVNLYGVAGLGAQAYQTRVNTLNANGEKYTSLYNDIHTKFGPNGSNGTGYKYEDRMDIRKALQDGMDDSYETLAETEKDVRRPGIFKNKTLNPVWSLGAGIAFKISPRVNIQIEDRITGAIGTFEDLYDGVRWDEAPGGDAVRTPDRDHINYLSVGVNFNIGNKTKSVEPLYWLNPLDFVYNELTTPRRLKVEANLTDSDGDGIADQLDKCPGTPAGVAVDAHGCPLDTDGDGVPDYQDKQLITPTECQPVNADGVGECPCNCDGVVSSCGNIGAGSLSFASGSAKLTSSMQVQLSNLAAQMSANPNCRVVIIGNGAGSKVQQQRSWDRVNAIIEYLSENHGIDRGRFIFRYGAEGDANTVMYRTAQEGEEGTGNVAPPFPNLRKD